MFTHQELIGFGATAAVSSWTPASLPSLKAWYRSDLGITQSGGVVDQWNDQSANAHHLTSTSTARPAYSSTGGPNSLPSLDFDGSNDKLAVTFASLSQTFHVFAVLKTTTVSGVNSHISGATSGERVHDTQGGCFLYFGGTGITRSPTHSDTTNFYLWEYLASGAASSVIRGSASATTGSIGTSSLGGLTLGQLPSFGYAAGSHCEIILASAAVSGANLTALRAYIAARYSLATN